MALTVVHGRPGETLADMPAIMAREEAFSAACVVTLGVDPSLLE